MIAYTLGSLWYFEVWRLASASERAWRLISAMFEWKDMGSWQYAQIYVGIAQTLAMAFLGTILATVASLFIGFLAARNTMPLAPIRHLVRRALDVLRGVDQLVWGLVFVRAVGLGPLAGVLAIFASDTGTLSKPYSEAIENIDRKQVEGRRVRAVVGVAIAWDGSAQAARAVRGGLDLLLEAAHVAIVTIVDTKV